MAIFGIGTDLLRVRRGDDLWKKHGKQAANKLMHPEEVKLMPQAKSPGYALARAFATKEAFVKALGTGFVGVSYRDVGVVRAKDERPRFVFSESMAERLSTLGITSAHLSLSDDGEYVLAFVVLETD